MKDNKISKIITYVITALSLIGIILLVRVLMAGEEGSSINRLVGTGIWYSVILGLIGLGFFIYDLVKGLIKS